MKKFIIGSLAVIAIAGSALAQVGVPEDAGLTPRGPTRLLNTNYLNASVSTGDITVSPNGKVLVAWENDGSGFQDWEGVWSMVDAFGNSITPPVTITNGPGSIPTCFAT